MTKKDQLHKGWQELLARAYEAGEVAAVKAVPTPMVVGTPKDLVGSLMGGDGGGFDYDKPTYFVSEGPCGFAWIHVRGSMSFRKWLEGKTPSNFPAAPALRHFGETWRSTSAVNPATYSAYDRATSLWIGGYGQSIARKEDFARAFARVLNEGGVEKLTAYPGSRMD